MQQRRMQALQKLRSLVDSDPGFQLCTFDGLNWIDPFTGSLVPAPFNFKAAAMKHFQTHDHWRGARPKPILELRQARWFHYLQENYDGDARFHFFSKQGNWLNPCNGDVCAGVLKRGGITPAILQNMARVLANFEEATPDSLLSLEELNHRHPTLSPYYEGTDGADDDEISGDELGRLDKWEELGSDGDLFGLGDKPSSAAEPEGTIEETRLYERPGVPPPEAREPPPPAAAKSDAKQAKRTASDDPETGKRTAPLSTVYYRRHDGTNRHRRRQTVSHRRGDPTTTREPTTGSTTARVKAERSSFHKLYAPPEAEQQEADDLRQARDVQRNLMGEIPDLPGIEFGLHFEPYRYIGGDFYDFIRISDKQLFFIVGDVSGHGTQAALVVGSILKSIRHLLLDVSAFDLTEILCCLNNDVRGDLIAGQFFTAFVGILDLSEKRRMQCICAGHHPCICINPNGPTFMRRVGKNGMALGMTDSQILRRQLKVSAEHFIPGDTLCIYTDGVQESMNRDGDEYGHWSARASFCRHIEQPAPKLAKRVAREASKHADGKPQDDMTVLAIRFV